MAGRDAAEARRAALARVDKLQRSAELDEDEAREVREQLHEALTADAVRTVCEEHLADDTTSPDWNDPGARAKELPDGVLAALDAVSGPATIDEVADEVDTSYRLARKRLEQLHDAGKVEQKSYGSKITLWWQTDTQQPFSNTTASDE